MRSTIRIIFAACLFALLAPARSWAGPVEGTMDEFRPAVVVIAKGVAKVLKSRKENAITVGTFSGPANLGTAAGPGLKKLVIEELNRLNVRVEQLGTPLGLSGEYRLTKNSAEAETKQVQIEVRLTDETGDTLTDLASSINVPEGAESQIIKKDGRVKIDTLSSPESTALAAGLTVDFDLVHKRRYGNLGDENAERGPIDIVKEALEKSTAFVAGGTELRASSTSPYGLQVVVGGRPRPLTLVKGQPFVQLAQGETFRLRLVNRSALGISAIFTLDGVNSFAFSEVKSKGRPKYTQWLFRPGETLDLAGWHINNMKVREFKVTDFSQSAAALLGSEGQLGAISVVIRATWPNDQAPPRDEVFAAAAPGSGIGLGDEIQQEAIEDNTDRSYGRVRSLLTIRYSRPEE